MRYQSWKTIKHYYDKVDTFNFNDYYKELVITEDADFIEKVKKELKKKDHGYSYGDRDHDKFDNGNELIKLINEDKVDMVKYSLKFSNQNALDNALAVTKNNQIDIIKYLVLEGARFTHKDSYSGNHYVFENLTGLMKYILNELEKKK